LNFLITIRLLAELRPGLKKIKYEVKIHQFNCKNKSRENDILIKIQIDSINNFLKNPNNSSETGANEKIL